MQGACLNDTDSYTPTSKGKIFILLEAGLGMEDLVGHMLGQVSGLNTMPPTYGIHAYSTGGLACEDFNGNPPRGPNHTRNKKTHTPTTGISQESFEIRWGMHCKNAPHHSKHNPKHTPRQSSKACFEGIEAEKCACNSQGVDF